MTIESEETGTIVLPITLELVINNPGQPVTITPPENLDEYEDLSDIDFDDFDFGDFEG